MPRIHTARIPLARFGALGAILACAASNAPAQQSPAPVVAVQRGIEAVPESSPVRQGHHYVVAIGIDRYRNWPLLRTAVSDADAFATLLTSQFGFEYAAPPLTDQSATRDNINALIDDDLRNKLKPEDDLVIFYAGHGTTRDDKVGKESESIGFLVPVEARAPGANEHWSDYLNVEEFLRKVSTLPPEHILVVLDSCHSGMALGSKFVTTRADTRFQQDMLRKVSRKVITSAQGDQLAADMGPLPGHSLFTGLILQGLTTGKADSFHQGFITGTQLGAYAQHEVGVAAGSKQTPLFGSFDLDDGGELIIPLGSGAPAGSTASHVAGALQAAPTLTALETAETEKVRLQWSRYWKDNDPLKNFPAARSAALKLCDKGDAWACGQAAMSFFEGLGGAADFERSAALARQGCQGNSPPACEVLGRLNLDGKGVARNYDYARSLFLRVCDAGEMTGCTSLGSVYAKGLGVEKDPRQGVELYRKACDGGDLLGCEALGMAFENGQGAARDAVKAAALLQQACDGGEMLGCTGLGYLYDESPEPEKYAARSVELFRKACDAGAMVGCYNLSAHYYNGAGIARNLAQAEALLHKACDGGYDHACSLLKSEKQ